MKSPLARDLPSHIDAWLIVAAFAVSLFFLGHNIQVFSLTYGLLLIWLLRVVWRVYKVGWTFPKTGMALAMTLYWVWLAITLLWSPVPFVSNVTFWWMSALPLTFWLFTLTPDQDRVWLYGSRLMLIVGLVLAGLALYQLLIVGTIPRGPFIDQNLYATLLNLLALPVAAYLLNLQSKSKIGRDWKAVLLALVLFLLVFVVAATKSRGAILSFLIAISLLLVVAFPHVRRKHLVSVVVLIIVAFFLANLTWGGGVVGKMQTLSDPQAAGMTRFLIWSRSWQMVEDQPWLGIGLGIYPLAWPAYRHPADTSGGYFAHNDYLHLWIEAGLPALILFLTVIGFAAWRVGRALMKRQTPAMQKIEIAGLAAGLATVVVHSFLEFNFYVLSTVILFGLILARLQTLTLDKKSAVVVVKPARYLGPAAYKTLSFLLVLFPLVYFTAIGLASYETDRSIKLAQQGYLNLADRALTRAGRLWPNADSILMTHADLYRHVVALLPAAQHEEKKVLFNRAARMLDRAVALDPLRPEIFLVRAELYRHNPSLAGSDGRAQVERDYQQALRLNPRYYHARVAYAQLLLTAGDKARARAVLEAGLHQWYDPNHHLVPYYSLAATLRAQAGDRQGAEELRNKIRAILPQTPPRVVNTPAGTYRLLTSQ